MLSVDGNPVQAFVGEIEMNTQRGVVTDKIYTDDIGKKGQYHTCVLADTSDAGEVVVDWSYGQFHMTRLNKCRLYHNQFYNI